MKWHAYERLTTDQEVGSSNLPGRAIILYHLQTLIRISFSGRRQRCGVSYDILT